MKHLVFIALGGAGGALARHWVSLATQHPGGSQFPWGTLLVNLVGSFCIGIVYVAIVEKGAIHPDWRSVMMVGFLGAFTTFSTFSLETIALAEAGQPLLAASYAVLSLVACVAAAGAAMALARLV